MNARERALCDLVRLGLPTAVAETIVRQLPAIQRAHEAACNWPEHIAKPFTDAGDKAFSRLARALDSVTTPTTVGQPGQSSMGVKPRLVGTRQHDPRGCCVELWSMPRKASEQEPLARLCARGFTARDVERIDAWQARIERAVQVAS